MIWLHILLISGAFSLMEFVAWFSHKYVMHGFLWVWHKDHHFKKGDSKSWFERNDLFFLLYAIPAMILIGLGFVLSHYWLVSLGAGITLYGLTYFMVHDMLIHGRVTPISPGKNSYINALVRAHHAHHWAHNKEDFRCFGLLVFPRRFFKP